MKFGCICNWGGFILALMEPRSDHPCCHIWFNGGGSSDDDDGNDDDDDADDDDEDHHNEHNEHNDDDDKGAAGNGQAGQNVPRESPPIITLVVNPPHLLRSNYIGDFFDDFHCSDGDGNYEDKIRYLRFQPPTGLFACTLKGYWVCLDNILSIISMIISMMIYCYEDFDHNDDNEDDNILYGS